MEKCDISQSVVGKNVVLSEGVDIAPFSIVGKDCGEEVKVGKNTKIGPYVFIEEGVEIGDDCVIDAYCRLCSGSKIGNKSKILYGAAIFENVEIGRSCIIGGDVADRTVVEDYVTYFGSIAHDYRIPGNAADWDSSPRPSPRLQSRCVVGEGVMIVGGVSIGAGSYIAAGQIVRTNIPDNFFLGPQGMQPLSDFKGLIMARTDKE